MSWNLITSDWRLKLLGLGLAILMLGAVAFSANPPTSGSVTVQLSYSVPTNLVLIAPPTKITVAYSGLADVIKNVNSSNMVATVDASKAKPGTAVKLNVVARSLITSGVVTVQQPSPIAVKIDSQATTPDLQVTVSAQAAPGWRIDTSKTYAACPEAQKPNPCTVHFTGPASWEKAMQAYVVYTPPVAGTYDILNQPIQLKNDSGLVDLTSIPTVPQAGLDVSAASLHIVAEQGLNYSTVPLIDAAPSHAPPAGYRVTGITITPLSVTISGDPTALTRVHWIQLPPVDLSGKTSSATFQVTIPYPDGTAGSIQTATVKYTIAPNPNVSATPSP